MENRMNLRRCLATSMFLLAMAGLTSAATITVGPGAGYDFGTIQAGIDAAVDGDTVLVAPGEYVITEPITFQGKAITVRSEAGHDMTIIRMGTPADTNRGSVVVFENGETAESILEGFTITGGRGCRRWVSEFSEFLRGGGGICFVASSGTVQNCAVVQNRVKDNGGGVLVYSGAFAVLTNCIISENVSTDSIGGGLFCPFDCSLTMTDCVISGNSSEANGGGGVGAWYGSLTLTRCAILSNTGGYYFGGGVYAGHSSATLTNCVIARNTAVLGGGGVMCSYADSSLTISNCTIWGNSGGGLYGGGGVLCGVGSATVTNSIVRANISPEGPEISVAEGGTLSIAYSNITGGKAAAYVHGGSTLNWGEGNIDADPHFACLGYMDENGTRDPLDDFWVDGDYRLKSEAGRWDPYSQTWVQDDVTSPCIDAGDPMSPIGWESFPNGGFVNMGAYGGTSKASKTYFGEPICEMIIAGDINGDGQVNRADLEIMALHWTDDVPLPLP